MPDGIFNQQNTNHSLRLLSPCCFLASAVYFVGFNILARLLLDFFPPFFFGGKIFSQQIDDPHHPTLHKNVATGLLDSSLFWLTNSFLVPLLLVFTLEESSMVTLNRTFWYIQGTSLTDHVRGQQMRDCRYLNRITYWNLLQTSQQEEAGSIEALEPPLNHLDVRRCAVGHSHRKNGLRREVLFSVTGALLLHMHIYPSTTYSPKSQNLARSLDSFPF